MSLFAKVEMGTGSVVLLDLQRIESLEMLPNQTLIIVMQSGRTVEERHAAKATKLFQTLLPLLDDGATAAAVAEKPDGTETREQAPAHGGSAGPDGSGEGEGPGTRQQGSLMADVGGPPPGERQAVRAPPPPGFAVGLGA